MYKTNVLSRTKRAMSSTSEAKARIAQAVYYLEQRNGPGRISEENGDTNRALFTGQQDTIDRHTAREMIFARRDERATFHRVILSPGPELPVPDMQKWVRAVMADFARESKQDVHWVCAVHKNTEHQHAHLLIGTSFMDGEGKMLHTSMAANQWILLRKLGDKHAVALIERDRLWRDGINNTLATFGISIIGSVKEDHGKGFENVDYGRSITDR